MYVDLLLVTIPPDISGLQKDFLEGCGRPLKYLIVKCLLSTSTKKNKDKQTHGQLNREKWFKNCTE
jgi:hypothetical protein